MYFNNDYLQGLNYYNYNQNLYQNLGDNINQTNDWINRTYIPNTPIGLNNMYYPNNFNTNNVSNINNLNNLNNLYPDIYKVTMPIIKNILNNTNLNGIDNNVIDSITNEVLKILEGNNETRSNNSLNSNSNANSTPNSLNTTQNSTSNMVENINRESNSFSTDKTFLKDIIRIIILNEIGLNNYKFNLMNMIKNTIV